MDNPWLNLPATAPYVLTIDREHIDKHNHACRTDTQIITGSFPQPFIGDPARARVVLLALNPGHSDLDEQDHQANEDFRHDMRLNLRHELGEHPFYPLNPKFLRTGAGKWWMTATKALQEAGISIPTLAERLMVIEWLPYHSLRFAMPKKLLPSQEYSFNLAKQMMGNNKLIVRMRSRKQWTGVHPDFERMSALSNPRCAHISRGNTKEDLFDRILAALRDN